MVGIGLTFPAFVPLIAQWVICFLACFFFFFFTLPKGRNYLRNQVKNEAELINVMLIEKDGIISHYIKREKQPKILKL